MSSFVIDTGPQKGFVSRPYDWVCDALPHDATDDQINVAMARAIIGEFHGPKTLKTVRKRLLMHWDRIKQLAEAHPETFDEILMEYAETTTVLP